MNYYDISLIAIALAMDASAITISNCTVYKNSLTRKKEFAMPFLFSVLQAIMPLIGLFVGSIFSSVLQENVGYLTSTIFFILSLKIVYDMIKDNKECEYTIKEAKQSKEKQKRANLTFSILFLQGIATSIDALVVGITFVNLTFNIFIAILMIFFITFIIVFLALTLGKKLGCVLGKYAEWLGAILLLTLAIKSFVQTIM